MNEIKTIILTSNEPWGDIWYSKQHYAHELSKLGHHVYFVNPCSNWKLKDLFENKIKVKQVSSNLYTINYNNRLPQKFLLKFSSKINDLINSKRISNYLKQKSRPQQTIYWKFDPFRFYNIKKNKDTKVIYHVVDPYFSFWQDKINVQNADLTICVSEDLQKKYFEKYNVKPLYIPHGISAEEQQVDSKKVDEIKKEFGDFFIYTGNLFHDFNTGLISSILKTHKVLILGKIITDHISDSILNHPNFMFLGIKSSKELNNYISASLGGLILYDFEDNITKTQRTPLKVINYIAQHKPVISSIKINIPELMNNSIHYANNIEEYLNFMELIKTNESMVDNERINNYLNKIEYSKLIKEILNQITLN